MLLLRVVFQCLVPQAAEAVEPGGNFYGGLGFYGVQPFGISLVRGERLRAGSAWSLYFNFESQRFLIGLEAISGHFGNDDTYSNPAFLGVRPGIILGSGETAPYASLGFGLMGYGLIGDDGKVVPGISSEVGVLFLRSRRWLRPSVVLQFNFPTERVGYGSREHEWLSWGTLGIRLLL